MGLAWCSPCFPGDLEQSMGSPKRQAASSWGGPKVLGGASSGLKTVLTN